MNKNTEYIQTPLMSCFVKMLEAEYEIYRFHNEINACDILQVETPELGLLDHALTIMGFPIDNSAEFYDSKNPNCYDHPDCFSRDWLHDKWANIIRENKPVTEFLEWAQIEVRAF